MENEYRIVNGKRTHFIYFPMHYSLVNLAKYEKQGYKVAKKFDNFTAIYKEV